MKNEILQAASGQHSRMTNPQGSLLFKLTGLMFWKPESLPEPNLDQASVLIGGMIAFNKHETTFEHNKVKLSNDDILECIQLWFPSIETMKQVRPHFFKKKQNGQEHEPVPEPKPETAPPAPHKKTGPHGTKPEHAPSTSEKGMDTSKIPHPKSVPDGQEDQIPDTPPQPTEFPDRKEVKGFETLLSLIKVGMKNKTGWELKNIWMVGPAGCGKTTLCIAAGEELELPVTIIPCGAGTSATTFLGYKYPEREGTPFVGAYAKPGIIVLDEYTSLESEVAQVPNAALANGELTSTIGTFKRHPECIIIATSNTYGHGADRIYVSNNQLDASTIDRFSGGILDIDYSKEYESQYDSEVTAFAWRLRDMVSKNGIRKVVSTRGIIAACLLKAAGIEWKNSFTANWSKDEKALLR